MNTRAAGVAHTHESPLTIDVSKTNMLQRPPDEGGGSEAAPAALDPAETMQSTPRLPPEKPLRGVPDPSQYREGKVFLGGLGPEMTPNDLTEYFGPMGTIVDIVVMRDKVSRNGRGFGFVTFQVGFR